jgi:hypothetical protein
MFVLPKNPYVENIPLNVMISGGRALRGKKVMRMEPS